jgi:hypothetical protein
MTHEGFPPAIIMEGCRDILKLWHEKLHVLIR